MDKKKKILPEIPPEEKIAREKALIDAIVAKVKAAQEVFANYTQEQVDKIFQAAALAASNMRIPLAQMAVEETGMGVVEDKVIKNHYASEYICNKFLPMKTCGIIETDDAFGMIKVAEPRGVIAGIIPTTNPTSTAIFKALISLKTRNGIVFSPHPRARKCTCYAAKIVLDAAVKAGAPKDIIAWIDEPTVSMSSYLMSHKDVALILATGGPGMVKAAYSSGTPAIGVGAGNVPVIMDDTCDVEMAVNSVLLSKTFDNGMIYPEQKRSGGGRKSHSDRRQAQCEDRRPDRGHDRQTRGDQGPARDQGPDRRSQRRRSGCPVLVRKAFSDAGALQGGHV